MKTFYSKNNKGFTLIEILFTVLILSMIIGVIGAFQSNIFSFNRIIKSDLLNQQEAKKLVRPFANEVRGAITSALGGYPIESASTSTLVFFTDIDDDGLAEKIRYFVEERDFKKGIIEPDPVTYQYDDNDESIIRVIHDITDQDIFYYYDSSYDGSASSTPLEYPVAPADIRMIKVIVEIDSNPNEPPSPFTVTTQVSLRNLKDNL